MEILFIFTTVTVASLGGVLLVTGALSPRGQPLPNADKLEEFIHSGLFPDKPRDMSFVEYIQNYTGREPGGNLTAALERLEFGVMDFDNLETAIKLAEDTRRLKELMTSGKKTRRQMNQFKIFSKDSYPQEPEAWTPGHRRKLFDFMKHSVYSTRYEINKLRNIRHKYRNSTVYRMGLRIGNCLELKHVAGMIYTTMARMKKETSMLWYLFHYHKLLNINYDMATNVEYIFMLQRTIDDGWLHYTADPPQPQDADSFTAGDPELD